MVAGDDVAHRGGHPRRDDDRRAKGHRLEDSDARGRHGHRRAPQRRPKVGHHAGDAHTGEISEDANTAGRITAGQHELGAGPLRPHLREDRRRVALGGDDAGGAGEVGREDDATGLAGAAELVQVEIDPDGQRVAGEDDVGTLEPRVLPRGLLPLVEATVDPAPRPANAPPLAGRGQGVRIAHGQDGGQPAQELRHRPADTTRVHAQSPEAHWRCSGVSAGVVAATSPTVCTDPRFRTR
ncbi:MAG: hypothetical protein AUI04_00325 [Candidatus Rokubacteria bacterium 13_2_20CM_2_64_8]|nr:MAG: hypothetical protein AUI04_00325 [Candidatus Rokubacteria bacterium 13_2_20CM_2_64_8]